MLLLAILGLVMLLTTMHPASAKIGTGQLYVYIDSDYTALAPQDNKGFYKVYPDQEVYIQIANITEFSIDEDIIVKIGLGVDGNSYTYTVGPLVVKTLESGEGQGLPGVGDENQQILWKVGQHDGGYIDIPPCNTITVHYKDASGTGPDYVTYDVTPPCITAHMHVIPGNPVGTVGAILLLFAGFGAYLLIKNRKTISVPKF